MNERQIKLYDLLFGQDKHVTAKVLAAQLKVTPKTIYLDVKAIEDEFTGFDLYIDRRPNQGLKLIGSLEEKQRLKNQLHMTKEAETDEFSLETRRQHIFKELLVEGKSLSLQDFAEQYFVSKTAILNDLDYFSRFMKPSNVQFETINKKIEVVGKGTDIQSAIVNYLLHISNESREQKDVLMRKYFGDMLFSAIQSIYNDSGLIDLSHMNDYYEESLLLNLLVFVARILAGKHYQSSNSLLANAKNRETYYLACDLCSLIAKRLEIVFQADDIEVLSQLLFAHKAFPVKKQNQSWGETVDELIRRLEQITDIVLDDTSELKGQLLSHLPAMIIRLSNGLRISNPFLEDIKTRHLVLFTASWYVLSVLESKYNVALNDDEVAFITIFFQMAISKATPSHNILVVCPYGVASSQFLVRKLRQILPRNDDITSCGASKLKKADLQDVDLIVTTTDIHLEVAIPTIKVSPLLTEQECAAVFDAYSNYIFLKKHQLPKSGQLHQLELATLNKYLRAKDLFFQQTLDSKEDCLNFLIEHFQANGYVKEGYRQSVFEREQIGSTVLENNVALPHGKPELCSEIAIGILTLRKPIKWTREHFVDMIVLLSVPQQMENEFGDIVLDIYHLIENSNIVAEIKKMRQGDDLISILQ